MTKTSPPRLRTALLISVFAAALSLGGCSKISDVTGSIGTSTTLPTNEMALRQFSETWGKKFEANPGNKQAAMTYARALRALTQYPQAVAVLQAAMIKNPTDMELLGAYGKALADAGRLPEAADILARSHTPERPNWSILSAQGSVADQLGNHEQAQGFYNTALKINPGEPSILSNLGLSYAMSKQLPLAESTLSQAVKHPRADMRVRQNMAMVLALQGKFTEAEDMSRRDLSPMDAAANVASIRSMIAQSNTWRDIQKLDAKPKASAPHKMPARS